MVPIPYFDGGTIINPLFEIGAIYMISNDNVGTVTEAGGLKRRQFRYILIPSGKPARMATINWNNYAEVKKYLGLTD